MPNAYVSLPLILDANHEVLDSLPPDMIHATGIVWKTTLGSGSVVYTQVYAPASTDQTGDAYDVVVGRLDEHLFPNYRHDLPVDIDVYSYENAPLPQQDHAALVSDHGAEVFDYDGTHLATWRKPLEFHCGDICGSDDLSPYYGFGEVLLPCEQAPRPVEFIVWTTSAVEPGMAGWDDAVRYSVQHGFLMSGAVAALPECIHFLWSNGAVNVDTGQHVSRESEARIASLTANGYDVSEEAVLIAQAKDEREGRTPGEPGSHLAALKAEKAPVSAPAGRTLFCALADLMGPLRACDVAGVLREDICEMTADAVLSLPSESVVAQDCMRVARLGHDMIHACADIDEGPIISAIARQMGVFYTG